jgi:hypothetical protein
MSHPSDGHGSNGQHHHAKHVMSGEGQVHSAHAMHEASPHEHGGHSAAVHRTGDALATTSTPATASRCSATSSGSPFHLALMVILLVMNRVAGLDGAVDSPD